MLLFSQRKKLAQLYEEWRLEGDGKVALANCPENVIAFLYTKGLINVEKTREYLNTHQTKPKK